MLQQSLDSLGPIPTPNAIKRHFNCALSGQIRCIIHRFLLDHLGRLIKDLGRDRNAELPGCLQVDHELELRRLFDG